MSLSPWCATATPSSAGDPRTLAGRTGSVSYGVTTPSPWVLLHTLLCVCPPSVESLFPPVLVKSCNQFPLAFKVRFSGDFSSRCWTPRLGSLMWGSESSLQWAGFFFKKIILFIYLFLAVLGLCCCTRAFSNCGEQGLLFIAVHGFLIMVVSLVAEHRL